jgi:hypothetical protein
MLGKWVAVLLLAAPTGIAAAQQPTTAKTEQQSQTQNQSQNAAQKNGQQDPLAAAARRAREQQKNQPRATKVWDNDNLPAAPEAVSVVGAAPAGSGDQSASSRPAGAQQSKSSEGSGASVADRKADLQKRLEAAKAHLKSAQTDFDIATRTYQLDQQTYYSNPNYLLDTAGAKKLKNEQNDISSKKQAVESAQKQVDDLNSKLQDLDSESGKS